MSYPYLNSESNKDVVEASKWSLLGHFIVFSLALIKSCAFPSDPKPFIPTLRVDLVELPNVLKKDLQDLKTPPVSPEIKKALSQPLPKPVVVRESSMTLPSEKRRRMEKKNLQALQRIKALSKIQGAEETQDDDEPSTIIRGNKLSPGAELSGEAREAAEANYNDQLRKQLKTYWILPPWIANRHYTAQARLFIDSYGRMREYRFEKVSGNTQFDEAVTKAIQASQSFPPPPKELARALLADGILVGFPL